ncbi:rhomboid family intramembrane serine protease [Mariprofundus sp. KV]|uniref:rhomboid family intramembrane serine protease n=1 Tax=Mariprofundus sp. KV TaxID=2608715 RepID=UPI0015A20061|nr:rhomboid family intramembrane serine protease [Mariprofundus sp. KV]NWF36348.1 hypothetical protein [Mariprofundus sp. KV]
MVGLLFILATAALWFLVPDQFDRLAFDRFAILNGEWWRLWSAHLVHYSRGHMITDVGTLFFLALVVGRFTRVLHLLIALVFAMPVITALVVLMVPAMEYFRGASAMVMMLWMVVSWYLIVESRGFNLQFVLGYALLAVLIGKVAVEYLGLMPPSLDMPRGYIPPWQVHIFGALVGLLAFNAFYQIYTQQNLRRIEKIKARKKKALPTKLKDYKLPQTPQQPVNRK